MITQVDEQIFETDQILSLKMLGYGQGNRGDLSRKLEILFRQVTSKSPSKRVPEHEVVPGVQKSDELSMNTDSDISETMEEGNLPI